MSHPTTPTIIGCDVGKAEIVIYNGRTGQSRTLPNRIDQLEPDSLIVCESTGGYEAALLQAALLAGRPAHPADARKVKAFIRSFGTLGKTDRLDAKASPATAPNATPPSNAGKPRTRNATASRRWVLTRGDLVGERQAHTNRCKAPGAARLQAVIACLTVQITAIEADIAALVEGAMVPEIQTLRSIKGIGKATAPALLALMPELGTLTGRQAAAPAGVAPHTGSDHGLVRRTAGSLRRGAFLPSLRG